MNRKLLTLTLALLVGTLIWNWPVAVVTPETTQLPSDETKTSTSATARNAPDSIPTQASNTAGPDLPQQEPVAPIAAFRDWAKGYLNAPQTLRAAMLPIGEDQRFFISRRPLRREAIRFGQRPCWRSCSQLASIHKQEAHSAAFS